jgi:hypothetical protein
MKHYFCVPVLFERMDPDLKAKGRFPDQCSGWVKLKDDSVGVVFQNKGPCPIGKTALIGHVTSICQDTGHWTDATYWYDPQPYFCLMSHEQRRDQAKSLAGKIRTGMTHDEVRKVLKDYEYIGSGFSANFSEQYYGHPNVMIEVPFEEPDPDSPGESKVNGRPTISEIDMPRP